MLKKKKAGLGFSFDSYISIQDVDGRALGSQGVKEKKKKNVCSTVCRGWGIGHSFKRQVFFSFFFFFNHVDTSSIPRVVRFERNNGNGAAG